jgi:hypothetical protein
MIRKSLSLDLVRGWKPEVRKDTLHKMPALQHARNVEQLYLLQHRRDVLVAGAEPTLRISDWNALKTVTQKCVC